ncbi:MAG TPA: Rieske (2Fe-2S) protein [Streptosporangiaceae bacterium]
MRRSGSTTVALMVLRGYLGVAFCYAGIEKLATPAFLDPSSPASLHALMTSLRYSSPLGTVLGWLTPDARALGAAVAAAELAVGLAVLAGLWSRWTAAAGALLSVTFWLTVSWHTAHWYENADIVYTVAWVVLGLAAPLPASADTWLTARSSDLKRPAAEPSDCSCTAARAEPAPTSALVRRRAILTRLGAVTGLAVVGGAAAARAISDGGNPAPSGVLMQEQVRAPSRAPVAVTVTTLPPGAATVVADQRGWARWLVHVPGGGFVALGTLCTHAWCPVQFLPGMMQLGCPCHGSIFDARTGTPIQGPAVTPLPSYPVQVRDGKVIVS